MTKTDDRETITSAAVEAARLRRQCIEGTERYRQALIAAGYQLARRAA